MTRVLIFLVMLLPLYASATDKATSWIDKNVWPESPKAATIREVTAPQPSLATGAADFGVPLFTLSAEGLNLNFEYHYHSNGIRVDDESCPWGYGWNLSPNIRLSRRILGRPDGLYTSVAEEDPMRMNHAMCFRCMNDSSLNISDLHLQSERYLDAAPDIFTVSLAGKQFSFLYVNGGFVTAGCSEYRIESDELLRTFVITDPQGFVYNFDITGEFNTALQALSEWYPSSITCPSGRKVTFTYIDCDNHKKNYQGQAPPAFTTKGSKPEVEYENRVNFTHPSFKGGKHLQSVRFEDEVVTLAYNNTGIKTWLNNITVTIGSKQLRQFNFFFKDQELVTAIQTPTGTYSFEYDPHTFHEGSGRDWWGFSNGRVVGNFYSPNVTINGLLGNTVVFNDGSDRTISAEDMQAKILKKATYPTGATVSWEYEPHRFDAPPTETTAYTYIKDGMVKELTEGGGLRVTKITLTNTEAGSQPQEIEYVYGPGGNGKAVCHFAPTLDTFINYKVYFYYVAGDNVGRGEQLEKSYTVSILPNSNYLDSHIGATPIWYSDVQEIAAEGKTSYTFEEIIEPIEAYGFQDSFLTYPKFLNQAFSDGPQLTGKTVYSKSDVGYKPVATETYEYNVVSGGDRHGYMIGRKLNYIGSTLSAPDFSEYLKFDMKTGWGNPDHNAVNRAYTFSEGEVYDCQRMDINVWREQLSKKITTEHLENGDYSIVEIYDYVDGTGLVSRTTTEVGGEMMTTTYAYPSASVPGVQQALASRNIVGLAIGETSTFRGSAVSSSAVMALTGNVFRPVHVNEQRGNGPYLYTPTYTWNTYGSLLAISDNSKVKTSYTWDATSRYPATMSVGPLTSTAEWNPGNGVSALTSPDGVRTEYSYDDAGRLIESRLSGHGPIQSWAYTISQSGNNYIRETDYRSASTSDTHPYTIARYDGLGRPTTAVAAAYASNGASGWSYIATASTYDAMGRPLRSYAAAPVGSILPTVDEVVGASGTFHNDNNPYSAVFYEPSQRRLATSEMKAGEAWAEAGKHVEKRRLTNDATHQCPALYVTATGGIGVSTSRPGTLMIEVITDEDGLTETTYTDSRGLCVLRERGSTKTYFVYNDYGDLCFILPPGLEPRAMEADDEDLLKLGYSYTYDDRGRLIASRWPGLPASEFRYDNANRLVAENNADLGDRWRLHFYDTAGREAFIAETATHPDNIAGLDVARQATFTTAGTYAGYSLPITLPADAEVTVANYYDDYDFISLTDDPARYAFVLPSGFTDTYKTAPKGRQTGLFSGAGYEAYYYDRFGRQIQQTGSGYASGRVSLRYNYAGQIVEERQEYPERFSLPTRITTTEYDGAGKTVGIKVKMGTAEASIGYSYDAIGRLAGSTLGNVSRSFRYDVHGWLTELTTRFMTLPSLNPGIGKSLILPSGSLTPITRRDSITERLHYAEGDAPRYNGFISSRVIPEGTFAYTYDDVGRLTEAKFHSLSTADFSTSYDYDARGNILALKRYGVVDKLTTGKEQFGLLDDLTATYDGNYLIEVSGAPTDATTFSGRAGSGLNNRSAELRWDDAGRLKYDESRSIVDIRYNTLGLPVSLRHSNGNLQTTTYDGLGRKMAVEYLTVRTNETQRREYYSGGLVVCNDTIETIRFAGGYFDSNLVPHYYITDYQGNNIGVTSALGLMDQETWYYPYGEPLRRPSATFSHSSANRYLYGDKEYANYNGESQYDFGARTFTMSGIPMASRHDQMIEKRPWESPFILMGANPVMFIDPDGNDIVFCGADSTSLTVSTDLIDLSVNVSSLGINFGGNIVVAGDELVSPALDVAGCVDPTGIADATNAVLQAKKGDWCGAFISGVGILPFGDFAKMLKLEKIKAGIQLLFNAASHGKGIKANRAVGKMAERKVTNYLKEIYGEGILVGEQITAKLPNGRRVVFDNVVVNPNNNYEILFVGETKSSVTGKFNLSSGQKGFFYDGQTVTFVGKNAERLGIKGRTFSITQVQTILIE